MERFGTKHFIYSSSATVYGAPTVVPISESTPLQPESAYGRTKFMCELIIKDAAVPDRGSARSRFATSTQPERTPPGRWVNPLEESPGTCFRC